MIKWYKELHPDLQYGVRHTLYSCVVLAGCMVAFQLLANHRAANAQARVQVFSEIRPGAGFLLYIDPATGCHYLGRPSGGIVERRLPDGRQFCSAAQALP